jgi:excisionase family DNA binding protein
MDMDAPIGGLLAYRVKPFCAKIGISVSSLYKYIEQGKIRVIRIGGRTLIPAEEAQRILREGVK